MPITLINLAAMQPEKESRRKDRARMDNIK